MAQHVVRASIGLTGTRDRHRLFGWHESNMRNAMTQDPEIEAIGLITTALGQLEDEQARARVLRYANERFGAGDPEPRRPQNRPPVLVQPGVSTGLPPADTAEPNFPEFVDLFDAANPATDVDRALVAAYWLQCSTKQTSWTGLEVNNLLKNLGHGLGNVTTAMNNSQKQKPALVRQMTKSGKARQARKTYKLTTAGVTHVRKKLGLSEAVPPALADNGEYESA
jgi:hypothetical protein